MGNLHSKSYGCLAMVIASGFFMTGCNEKNFADSVAYKWSEEIRALHMYPVFPPREDIQVGDVILTCVNQPNLKAKVADLPLSIHVARLDINSAMQNHYRASVELPNNMNIASGVMATSDTLFQEKDGKYKNTRLRNVAFPDNLHVELSTADIGALIPAGVVLGQLGLSAEDFASGSLSIPSSSQYGLTLLDLEDVVKVAKIKQSDYLKNLVENYQTSACSTVGQEAKLILVQSVYSANTIRLQLNAKSEKAGYLKAGWNLPAESTLRSTFNSVTTAWAAKTAASAPVGAAKAAGEVVGEKKSNDIDGLTNSLISSLQNLSGTASNNGDLALPGVTSRVMVGSAGTISMDRSFNNPVVIGYAGVPVSFDKDNKLYILAGMAVANPNYSVKMDLKKMGAPFLNDPNPALIIKDDAPADQPHVP